jgi:hypothetical protein
MAKTVKFTEVVEDLRQFFVTADHWAYRTPGSESSLSPKSVYHITQIEVLLEDHHFHDRTYRALEELREEGFISTRDVTVLGTRVTLVWKTRYVERAITSHTSLMAEYMSPVMTKATGDYAEMLTLMGLSRLKMDLVDKHTASYRGKTWTQSGSNLDLIMEKDGVGYVIEVKNTFDYIPDDELKDKLELCKYLGIVPLFIVRNRHANQWALTKSYGGLLYVFKSKIFPPGHEALVQRLWQEMRLPIAIWTDWPGQFYPTIDNFLYLNQ